MAAAGEFNGDGLNDFAIAAPFLNNGGNNLGSVFVVFGQVGGFGQTFDVTSLNGQNGFRIDGDTDILQHRLVNIRDAGDVNNDGFDDILNSGVQTQSRHIVFGADQGFSPSLSLANLDGQTALKLPGLAAMSAQMIQHRQAISTAMASVISRLTTIFRKA